MSQVTKINPNEAKQEKTPKLRHWVCIPCSKTMCGQDRPGFTPKKKPRQRNSAWCVVCDDLWKSLHCCVYCGKSSREMWGPK